MCDNGEDHVSTNVLRELAELGNAIKPLFRRLPGAMKAIDKLTGGLTKAGAKALESRWYRYRTDNLVIEAQQVANATGLPVPVVFDRLVRQRRIDELAMDALRRVSESIDEQDEDTTATAENNNKSTTDRWFHTFYEEASTVDADEEDVREAFVRILAGEMQVPGSFSLRTLRAMSAMSRSTAQRFRRAASVSIRLTPDGKHVMDARIPAIGGDLGQNCLKNEGLSYDVLIDMTENGLIHPDYRCYHPYGPLVLASGERPPLPFDAQIPFAYQGAMWVLIPKADVKKARSLKVPGAKLHRKAGRPFFPIRLSDGTAGLRKPLGTRNRT